MSDHSTSPVVENITLARTGSVFVFEFSFDPLDFRLRRTDVPDQVVQLEKIWSDEAVARIATMPNEFMRFCMVVDSLREYLQDAYPAQKIKLRLIRAMNKDYSMSSIAVESLNADINPRSIVPSGLSVTTVVKFDFEVVLEEESRMTDFWPGSNYSHRG